MCTPSIRLLAAMAFVVVIVAPAEDSDRFLPMSMSSAVAVTVRARAPTIVTWKTACSSSPFSSAAACSVTIRHAFQLAGVKTSVSPLLTERPSSPEPRAIRTVTFASGAWLSRR